MRDTPLWVHGRLQITRAAIDKVFAEARKAYGCDEESCGFLLGPRDPWQTLDEVMPMVNRANQLHALDPVAYPRTGRMYFDIDSMKFQRAIEQGHASERPVKVLYHSHLDVGAYFSDTDAQVALMGGSEPPFNLAYLVTSVRAGEVDDHALFVWADGGFVRSPLEVLG
jgi:proteasome lid subunit RPN8/RPN11